MRAKSKAEGKPEVEPMARPIRKAKAKTRKQAETKAKSRTRSKPKAQSLTPYDELMQAWEKGRELIPDSVATVKDIGPLIYDSCGDDLSAEMYAAESEYMLAMMNGLNGDGEPWVTIGLLKMMTSPLPLFLKKITPK